MIVFEEIRVKTPEREVLLEITNEIKKIVKNSNINEGTCRIFVPHTTAGITINENADRSVMKDVANYLNKLIPKGGGLGYYFLNAVDIRTTINKIFVCLPNSPPKEILVSSRIISI